MIFGWFRKRRRTRLLSQAWPSEWDLHLNRNVRLTWQHSADEKIRLQDRIKIFVGEKHWEGLEGLELNDEIKVTIAGQACLMLMGVEDYVFDNVKTILVFPQSFFRESNEGPQHRSGEAWQGGPIVLSWKDSLRGGRNEDDGQNVVIHEFAHALDGLDGEMGGNISFDSESKRQQWREVVEKEYAELVDAESAGRSTLLDPYGATNRAEFFAVAAETFFEQPHRLFREHTQLFELLADYFHLDPRQWQKPRARRR